MRRERRIESTRYGLFTPNGHLSINLSYERMCILPSNNARKKAS